MWFNKSVIWPGDELWEFSICILISDFGSAETVSVFKKASAMNGTLHFLSVLRGFWF